MNELQLLRKVKLFWDIDGTLIRTNGAAALPFAKAVSDFAGIEVTIDRKKLSGYTDYEIAMYLLQTINVNVKLSNITKILEDYAVLLPSSLRTGVVEKIGLVDEVLHKLTMFPEIEIAIGTGNFLTGAKIKLGYIGLLDLFNESNIFCASEKYWNRDLIIKSAKDSLKDGQIGIVIGDSPKDIISAKNLSLKVFASPTGAHSRDELAMHGPDVILKDSWGYEDLIWELSNLD
jgi:phosphoglycolate phosphatase-like HAD superfamily hydrolase